MIFGVGFFILFGKLLSHAGHEICVILDRHVEILNVIREVIPNHALVHHR
jgi:hypothetical protein